MLNHLKHGKIEQVIKGAVLFILVFFSFQFATLGFTPKAKAAPPASLSGISMGSCDWKSASQIVCAGVRFYFDPVKSISAGHAIFAVVKEDKHLITNNETLYLHLNQGGPDTAVITRNLTNTPTKDDPNNIYVDQVTSDDQAACQLEIAGGNHGGEINGTETIDCSDVTAQNISDGWRQYGGDGTHHLFICGLYTRNSHTCWNAAGPSNGIDGTNSTRITISDPGGSIKQIQDNIGDAIASRENCTADSGLLGFVLCPLVEATRSTVSKLIGGDGSGKGFLVELLTVRPLSSAASNPLFQAWVGIRNIALGLYIVVFALIIFGNGVGYDPYTIKKALPKLAIGVLLTFASFYIVQTLIDLSNLVGNALPAFIANITNKPQLASYNISLPLNALGWGIVILLIASFLAVIALIIGIAGLMFRVIVIYALVLLAPIAFVAWVLPNTESAFKKWWKNLIKVLMMFPIVTGMLSLALFFQTILLTTPKDSGGLGGAFSSGVTSLMGIIIPLVALIMIPKTFKWGGEAFAAGAGYLAGKAQGGTNKVKSMPGKAANKAAGSAKKGIQSSDAAQKFGMKLATTPGIRALGGRNAQRSLTNVRNERIGAANKLVENLDGAQLGKLAENGNLQERTAAIGRLAKNGDRARLKDLSLATGTTKQAYELASSQYAGDWGSNLDLRRFKGSEHTDMSTQSIEKISQLSPDAFASNLSGGNFTHGQLSSLASNDRARSVMAPQARADLDAYMGQAHAAAEAATQQAEARIRATPVPAGQTRTQEQITAQAKNEVDSMPQFDSNNNFQAQIKDREKNNNKFFDPKHP